MNRFLPFNEELATNIVDRLSTGIRILIKRLIFLKIDITDLTNEIDEIVKINWCPFHAIFLAPGCRGCYICIAMFSEYPSNRHCSDINKALSTNRCPCSIFPMETINSVSQKIINEISKPKPVLVRR